MSRLPQLVGLLCIRCGKEIQSITEGVFCPDCGNPVHAQCYKAGAAAGEGRCPSCGGDPSAPSAQEAFAALQQKAVESRGRGITLPLKPVPGDTVCLSKLHMLLISVVAVIAGLLWLYLGYLDRKIHFHAIILTLIGVGGLLLYVALAVNAERVVVGEGCLQVVRGGDQVILQVPYENIAEVSVVKQQVK